MQYFLPSCPPSLSKSSGSKIHHYIFFQKAWLGEWERLRKLFTTMYVLHALYCYFRLFDFFLSISSKHQFIQSHFHLQRPNWEVPQNAICVCVCMHAQLQNCHIAPGSRQSLSTMQKNFQRTLSKVRSPQVATWGQFYQSDGPDASGEGRK